MMISFRNIIKLAKRTYAFQLEKKMCYSSQFTEDSVTVNGTKINYVKSGQGSKAVLLMPGALGSAWTDFQPQIENLPNLLPGHTLIAWDPPGYGKSLPLGKNFHVNFLRSDAEHAKSLMDSLGMPKFSILGWSDGGITGLILSASHPESVEKLVIWGAGAYVNADEMKTLENIRDVNKWSKKMREPMEQVYGEEFATIWSNWVDGMSLIFKTNNGNLCKDDITKIKAPVLIMHGKKDPLIASEHIPYLLGRLPKAECFEFDNGKHNIHLQFASEFNEKAAKFLLN